MSAEKCTLDCKDMDEVKHDIKILEDEVVRKKTVRWFFGITITLFGIFFLTAWNSSVRAKDERMQNKQDIAVIGVSMNNMKELLIEIKNNQVTKGDIYKIVKRVKEDKED